MSRLIILAIVLLNSFILMPWLEAKKVQLDTDLKLSEYVRRSLNIEVLAWDFGENPVISFDIDSQGKVKQINFIKKRSKSNASICANDLISIETFPQEFRNKSYTFECKPYPDLSKKEFKQIRKYTKKYFTQVNSKINAHWFPDPRKYKLKALVAFDLYQDGHVANLKFLNSSNDEEYDKLAKKAIELSSPFSPLDPKIFTFLKDKEKINVVYDFDNSINYQNQLNRSVGVGFGSYGTGLGFGLGYGNGGFRNRRWGRPFYSGYPYWW